ncbi:MAG: hypothetical protein Q9163_000113 [Psora crenata]
MADLSEPALERGIAKVKEILPSVQTRLETIKCDVSNEADVERMITHLDSWGGVDIIFNNAGIMHGADTDAIETPEKIWDLTHNINVKGVWFGCKHAVLSMRKHGKKGGSVINTASVVALVGSATPQLAYTASKGAVLAMTRELAIVHAKEGIRFNALCPAPLKQIPTKTSPPIDKLSTDITGEKNIHAIQGGVAEGVGGTLSKGGLLGGLGDLTSKEGVNRAERGDMDPRKLEKEHGKSWTETLSGGYLGGGAKK